MFALLQSEALYSGAIEPAVTAEILAWHQTQQGPGVKGSRLKLGVLSGCGGDQSCGNNLETFTIHGWVCPRNSNSRYQPGCFV